MPGNAITVALAVLLLSCGDDDPPQATPTVVTRDEVPPPVCYWVSSPSERTIDCGTYRVTIYSQWCAQCDYCYGDVCMLDGMHLPLSDDCGHALREGDICG